MSVLVCLLHFETKTNLISEAEYPYAPIDTLTIEIHPLFVSVQDTLYYTTLPYTAVYCTTLPYIALQCPMLPYT